MKTPLLLLLLLAALPAHALTIILQFHPTTEDAATNRLGPGNIHDVMRAAADYWQLAIRDDYSVHIHYQWGFGNISDFQRWSQSGGRTKVAWIQFVASNVVIWWLDGTPWDSEEFPEYAEKMEDRGGGLISTGRSYRGGPTDGPNAFDLFTRALFEIGHALGVFSGSASWAEQCTNGFLTVTSPLPFAGSSIDVYPTSSGLLLSEETLMRGARRSGQRVLPSTIDILACAQLSGFTNLNLDLHPALEVKKPLSKSEAEWNGYIIDPASESGSRFRGYVGGCISTTNEAQPLTVDNSGKALYQFHAPIEGNYGIDIKLRALDGSSNSIWINIDALPVDPDHAFHITNYTSTAARPYPYVGTAPENRTVTWQGQGTFYNPAIVPKLWHLARGPHLLYVVARERGCELDALTIYLAQDQPAFALYWFAPVGRWQLKQRFDYQWLPMPPLPERERGQFVMEILTDAMPAAIYQLQKE
jgi:hypothetical protein